MIFRRMHPLLALCALLAIAAIPLDADAQRSTIPVQLGARLTPDTVTVGQRFIAVFRVRVPRDAVVSFPQAIDSALAESATAVQLIGVPVIDTVADSTGTTISGAYRLAAWDTGPQPLGLRDIVVRLGADTGYVALASRTVFVRSVLPEDSSLRVPKPPRAAIHFPAFEWMPWLIAALAAAAAALLWRIYVWYRRRRAAPLDPFSEAQRDFARIEAMGLLAAGESHRHAAMMTDAMRKYLAARVPGIEISQTSSEMLANAAGIHEPARGLGELLWRTDLIKFANNPVDAGEAERLGTSAREIVRRVESHMVELEKQSAEPAERAA